MIAPVLRGRSRRAIGNAIALFALVVILVTAAIGVAMMQGSPSGVKSQPPTTSSTVGSRATFLVRIVDASGLAPMAGVTVVAAPIQSPNDVALTPGGPSINECVQQVPNGATVDENGNVVLNGSTTTFAPCPLKEYTTNSTGWVSITNATGVWYFIKAGNVMEWNYVVVGVMPDTDVNMAIPLPSGNATVPSSHESCVTGNGGNVTSTCTSVPGLPVFEPPTTLVWPCGEGLPNGSAATAQGFYGGYYIAYSYAAFPNGTKAALPNDCGAVESPPPTVGSMALVSGAMTIPKGNQSGSLVITVKNNGNSPIDVVSVTNDATNGNLVIDGSAVGGSWNMALSPHPLPLGYSASTQYPVEGAIAGQVYDFTIEMKFASGSVQTQMIALTAQM